MFLGVKQKDEIAFDHTLRPDTSNILSNANDPNAIHVTIGDWADLSDV